MAWVPGAGREAHQVAVGTQRLCTQRASRTYLRGAGCSAVSLKLSDGSACTSNKRDSVQRCERGAL